MAEVELLLQRADVLLDQRRPKDAEKQLADALKQEPDNDLAIAMLARCKYDQRLFSEGIALMQQAIGLSPLESYYFYLLGFGHFQADNHTEALQQLRKAVELNPHVADYFGLWSLVLIEEKDFRAALEKANEGLAVDPQNITSLNARATALNKLRRVDDAIETMHTALSRDPDNAYTHSTVGWNMLEKGRHREATTHFREALRIDPNLAGARAGLKQSLKSKIAPYRWLLQYSFWVNNKGKKAKWIIPIGIYLAVQLIRNISKTAGDNWAMVGGIVVGAYIMVAAISWIINPIANFFLLFYKDGKYALTRSEKWCAVSTVGVMIAGLLIVLAGLLAPEAYTQQYLIGGILLFSLAVPLGQLDFPPVIRYQWISLSVLLVGIVAFVLTITGLSDSFWMIYIVLFVLYTWLNAFSSGR